MRKLLLLLTFIISASFVEAQEAAVLSTEQSIYLEYSDKIGLHYIHQFQPAQTLYSISKLFGSNPEEVKKFNIFVENNAIPIGEKVIIPVRTNHIITYEHEIDEDKEYISIYYKTRPKDNLFRISREFFPQDISALMERNQLTSLKINIGQNLKVGWLPINGVREIALNKEKVDSMNLAKQNGLDSLITNDSINEITPLAKSMRGIAVWDKSQGDQTNLFVLHKRAKINSVIELSNPMYKDAKVYARVVGRIPSKLYPSDVSVIISPRVAKSLRVIDPRFLIEMRYYE